MMHPDQLEEMEFAFGRMSYPNESSVAFEQSRRELDAPASDNDEIKRLRLAGKFVVARETILYCPRTDAILGARIYIRSVHDTEAAARAVCPVSVFDDDYDCENDHLLYPVVEGTVPEDIPF